MCIRDSKKESIKVYKTLKVHITAFNRNRDILFNDMTIDFIQDFINYLQNKDYSDNHVNKIISTMKTVLNDATEIGCNKKLDYKSKRIKAPKRASDNIYLTPKEINDINELKNLPRLTEQVRDLFVVGCYTGLRYSDFNNLTESNISALPNGRKALRVITKKTEDIVWIPINTVVAEILKKYKYKLPNGIANQIMNVELKDIGKRANLNSKYLKRTFRKGRAVTTEHFKYELLTTHCARRSFATNAYKAKLPMLSIMKITGHTKPETFMKYIKIGHEGHAELLSEYDFFK